jgi:tRNA-dihydrouridine synthase B
MRAGWNEHAVNAPTLARMVKDAGASAVAVHGRTAAQSYSGASDWELIARVAAGLRIPVFGSGDCVEPHQVIDRMAGARVSGVLVGRGALRNPWIFAQAADIAAGREPRIVTMEDRGRFLLDYIDLLLNEGASEAEGFRHSAFGVRHSPAHTEPARGRERWVINKLRALNSWYTKGLENGGHLRVAINSADSVAQLRDIVNRFFFAEGLEDTTSLKGGGYARRAPARRALSARCRSCARRSRRSRR